MTFEMQRFISIFTLAKSTTKEAGEKALGEFEQLRIARMSGKQCDQQQIKEGDDPRTLVTKGDQVSHDLFLKNFSDTGMTIVAEEGVSTLQGLWQKYRLIIDDWDGTSNGAKGVRGLSAISCALDKDKSPCAGIWYNPYFQEMVYYFSGFGRKVAYIDPNTHVSLKAPPATTKIAEARFVLGRGTKQHRPSELARLREAVMEDLNYASSVVSLMSVALGRVDGFAIAGNKAWDLWSARTIFVQLGIPFAFYQPTFGQRLSEKELNNFHPDQEFSFLCAANQELFEQAEPLCRR